MTRRSSVPVSVSVCAGPLTTTSNNLSVRQPPPKTTTISNNALYAAKTSFGYTTPTATSTESLVLSITASYISCADLITQCNSLRARHRRCHRSRPPFSTAPGAECAPVPPPTPYCSLSASYARSHGEVKSVYDAGVVVLGTVFVEGCDPFLKRLWAQSQALLVSIDILTSLLAHPSIVHMPLPLADLLATSETARRVCIAAMTDQYAHLAASMRPRKAIPPRLPPPPRNRASWKTLLHDTLTRPDTRRRGSSVSLSASSVLSSSSSAASTSTSASSLYSPARTCSLQSTPRTRPSLSQLKEEPESDRDEPMGPGANTLLLPRQRRLSASTLASQYTQAPSPGIDDDDECIFTTVLMPRPRRLISPTTAAAPQSPRCASTNTPSSPPLTPRLAASAAASLSSAPALPPEIAQDLIDNNHTGHDNSDDQENEEDDDDDTDANRLSVITIPARYPSGIFPKNSVFSVFCPEALSLQVDPLRSLPPAVASSAENNQQACRRCDYVWRRKQADAVTNFVHANRRQRTGAAAAVMLKDGFCMTQRFLAKSHAGSDDFGCVLCTSTGKTDIYSSVDSLRDHLNAYHTKWQMLHDKDLSSGIQP